MLVVQKPHIHKSSTMMANRNWSVIRKEHSISSYNGLTREIFKSFGNTPEDKDWLISNVKGLISGS